MMYLLSLIIQWCSLCLWRICNCWIFISILLYYLQHTMSTRSFQRGYIKVKNRYLNYNNTDTAMANLYFPTTLLWITFIDHGSPLIGLINCNILEPRGHHWLERIKLKPKPNPTALIFQFLIIQKKKILKYLLDWKNITDMNV